MVVSSSAQRSAADAESSAEARPASAVENASVQSIATFDDLVAQHLEFVWRCLRRFGVPPGDVDDAAQQVFMVASEKFARIQPGRERPFLVGVATRVASHARRAHQRREVAEQRLSADPAEPSSLNPNPEELTQKLEARELLDRVLESMPQDLRAVFALFELEDLSVDQIAVLLEIPRGTAATRLRRSRHVFHDQAQKLKAEIESRGGRL